MPDPAFWRGRRVLVTGHTGFKGAWLSLWLHAMGARIHGLASRAPGTQSLFALGRVDEVVATHLGDLRDLRAVEQAVAGSEPEIVFHLAGRAILNRALKEPVPAYATNVLGTVHLLEAVREVGRGVGAVVCVTSDKCYLNREWDWGYRETDTLGGTDPYSSSKACQELVVAAYRDSLLGAETAVATGRAGNVIGGGDWGEDRLVPDIMRAALAGEPVTVRNPESVRSWQHVLSALAGYLRLAERLLGDGREFAEAWNFSPAVEDARSVGELVGRLRERWTPDLEVREPAQRGGGPEAGVIMLDSAKARRRLGWTPVWSALRAVDAVVDWYDAYRRDEDMRAVTLAQIAAFEHDQRIDAVPAGR